jgi:hypothetical protein
MLSLPSALWWAFFGAGHTEWDMSLSHIAIFVSVLEHWEGNELLAVWDDLRTEAGRKRINDQLPEGKNTFLRVFNSVNPQLPGSGFALWWRQQDGRRSWFLVIVDVIAALRP